MLVQTSRSSSRNSHKQITVDQFVSVIDQWGRTHVGKRTFSEFGFRYFYSSKFYQMEKMGLGKSQFLAGTENNRTWMVQLFTVTQISALSWHYPCPFFN